MSRERRKKAPVPSQQVQINVDLMEIDVSGLIKMQRRWHFNQCQWLNEDFDVISASAQRSEEGLNPVFKIHLKQFHIAKSRCRRLSALWWSLITGTFKQHWQRILGTQGCSNMYKVYDTVIHQKCYYEPLTSHVVFPLPQTIYGADSAPENDIFNGDTTLELRTAALTWQHLLLSLHQDVL